MELQFLSNKTEDAVSGVLLCFVNILVVCMYNPVVKRVSDVERVVFFLIFWLVSQWCGT